VRILSQAESSKVILFDEKLHQKVLRENKELKRQLREILDIACENQQIQDHFEALEQKILRSRSITDMARAIAKEIKQRFEVDYVTICLALEAEDVLCQTQGDLKGTRGLSNLRIVEPKVLRDAIPKRIRGPILQGGAVEGKSPFFSKRELASIKSNAVVPLFLSNKLIGTLNLGSQDADRYSRDKSTDFLRKLGCKISLAMDNIIAHQRLLELSVTDQLTGISNRRHFDEALKQEVERSQRYNASLACMVVDLDGFKAINDQHGHQIGDQALKHVARILRDNSRRQDVVARYGGDEFAIILPHTALMAAVRTAEKYAVQLQENPFQSQGEALPLKLSIGVAAIPETQVDPPEDLVKEADRRLFHAKEQKGIQVVYS
jgi:two-component system cell cycle response regulator